MMELVADDVKKIIIEGITENGRKFRPSDWAERMSGALSTFGRDQRIQYSPLLQPLTVKGVKCVAIDPRLKCFLTSCVGQTQTTSMSLKWMTSKSTKQANIIGKSLHPCTLSRSRA